MKRLILCAALIGPASFPAAVVAQTSATATGDTASAEITCKRFVEPGTLIKRRKICLTRDQWSQLAEAAQRKVEYLQFNNMGGADGCKPGSPGC